MSAWRDLDTKAEFEEWLCTSSGNRPNPDETFHIMTGISDVSHVKLAFSPCCVFDNAHVTFKFPTRDFFVLVSCVPFEQRPVV